MRAMVGTSDTTVTPSASIRSTAPATSKRDMIASFAPSTNALASRASPMRCAIGVVIRMTSSARRPQACAVISPEPTIRLAWVEIAPFGRPVVPEV